MPSTREALAVFWDGDEVPGILAYGYWRGASEPEVEFPPSWPAGTEYRDGWLHNWQEGDRDWRVLHRTIRLPEWPDRVQWKAAIERTLRAFLDAGARVAWLGIEGHFVDPPDLFDPAEMTGGVWAALTPGGELRVLSDIDGSFTPLSDSELGRLRKLTEDERELPHS